MARLGMLFDADALIDRRRLKRRLTVWQVVAVVAIVTAITLAIGPIGGITVRDHVARLTVDGIIINDLWREETIGGLADDDRVKAVILRIDSPGGTVVGGEVLYRQLRHVAEFKPVVAVMGELATSAAYMTALGGDRIFAHEGTVTGSIGVILQSTDITGLLDKIGVKAESVKSSPLKAQPNPLEPFSKEAREATRSVILNIYESFVALVQERRALEPETVRVIADGRVFTGLQAIENGLVDAIGGEDDARRWLAETHGISTDVPTLDVDLEHPEQEWLDLIEGMFGKTFFSERLRLDGLVSLWHPSF